jgi:RHS repeat-associated protein
MAIGYDTNGNISYKLRDGIAETFVLTTSGTISATQTYRAYGLARSSTGTIPTRYQFTGQYQDDSGLTFMNARYYDPSIGTFISADNVHAVGAQRLRAESWRGGVV